MVGGGVVKSGFRPMFGNTEGGGKAGDVEYLVIDASYLAHRNAHAMKRFATGDGRLSGHIYGSFKGIRHLISSYRPKNLVFVYDRGAPWRMALVPEYKANRRADNDGTTTAPHALGTFVVREGMAADWTPAPDIERLFRCFPGLHLALDGAEADDLAAWFVHENPREMRTGAIGLYTNDRDYWQLVSDEAKVAAIVSKKAKGPVKQKSVNVWVRDEDVMDHFGVAPPFVARLKALLGDDSDNIKGLQGASRPGKKDGLRAFVTTKEAEAYFDPKEKSVKVTSVVDWLAAELNAQREQMIKNRMAVDLSFAVERLNERADKPKAHAEKGLVAACLDVLVEFECESLLGQVEEVFTELSQAQR
jgi:5'-3' exonuclease